MDTQTSNYDYFPQPICEQVWNQKYRFQTDRAEFKSDENVEDTWHRIATACATAPHFKGKENSMYEKFYHALYDFKFLPAGRIISGAGTERNVTLFNCYVMGTIPDSLDGIFDMLKEAALTMQQGGGIGYDFSTLRPKGAPVRGVESHSSGPLTFMDVWDSMCKTIMSAGSRRGAMMATMRCDHPDIMEFIEAKRDPLRLRNFNLSVLVTDEFMKAVEQQQPWQLIFNGELYDTIPATIIWDKIMESTYHYAEPGVIFIDRINQENNLHFLETISATNPCGEQPLPPYGACLLGSINLVKFIEDAFTHNAKINWTDLKLVVKTAVTMLDSIIDISKFPLDAQRSEALFKRRIGLGVTGLADALFMLGIKYGSPLAISRTDGLMNKIARWAYEASIELAQEYGPAPFIETDEARNKFNNSGFMQRMPDYIKNEITLYGIRNSHLLSIAPTGTISMFAGNVSSGVEPIFAPVYNRVITRDSGEKDTEVVSVYSVNEYLNTHRLRKTDPWWLNNMVTAQELYPEEHVYMQAAVQKWVDSSISKTVNCPEDISFEDFKAVYKLAYDLGCKGCTTYRPNDVTGSVLSVVETKKEEEILPPSSIDMRIMERPDVIKGHTYKIRWAGSAYYVTFNHVLMPEGWLAPFEIFINTKNVEHQAWIAALTRMISAVFQRGGDIRFVYDEMKNVFDSKGGGWINGRYVPSLVALLGYTLEEHLNVIGYQDFNNSETKDEEIRITDDEHFNLSELGGVPIQCDSCSGFNTAMKEGCKTCLDCGYSECG